MCKIIQFPVKENSGYKNMVALFEVCDTVESCNFYLESVEQLFQNDSITDNELYTLRRIGRQKRINLSNTESKPIKAEKPGVYTYTTEMGQKEPEGCQIEAGLCYYGKHYWIRTPLELKGRGITENEPSTSKNGWRNYTVTTKTFEKLKGQYAISMECCLD